MLISNAIKNHGTIVHLSILGKNHRQYVSIAPELGHKPGTKDCESYASVIKLAEVFLNSSSKTNEYDTERKCVTNKNETPVHGLYDFQ